MNNKIVQEDLEYIFKNFDKKDSLKNTKIVMTGCAGFLGFYFLSFLLKYAKELGVHSVIGVDNLKMGEPAWLKALEAEHQGLLVLHSCDVSKDDILSIEGLAEANYVIHMASIASPTFYRKYPVETIDANVWGLRLLLDFYKNKNIKGFLFYSTSEIYGDPAAEAIPTPESYRGNVNSIGPRACYDEAKRFGETLCYTYANEYKMPIIIVRSFNNFGPGLKLDDRRVPADFAKSVLDNKDIIIHSDGKPTRTFCYVADAIVGYLKALTYGEFEFFNIGMDSPEISIREFAETFAEKGKDVLGYKGSVRFEQSKEKEYLTHNPSRRCPSINKAKDLLGFNPTIKVGEGIERFLKYFDHEKGGA